MGLKCMTAKSNIAPAGKYLSLKKIWKRWPYIPIRPEKCRKIASCSCKINKHNTCKQCLLSINKCVLFCPNNIPRMVTWLYMVMSPCNIHHLNSLDFNKIYVRPSTNLCKAKWYNESYRYIYTHRISQYIVMAWYVHIAMSVLIMTSQWISLATSLSIVVSQWIMEDKSSSHMGNLHKKYCSQGSGYRDHRQNRP